MTKLQENFSKVIGIDPDHLERDYVILNFSTIKRAKVELTEKDFKLWAYLSNLQCNINTYNY